MKIADSHAHLYDNKFNEDRTKVIDSAKNIGISIIIIPSEDISSGKKALSLSENFPVFLYPAIGFHPHNTEKFDIKELKKELKRGRYIAIGEIGLDYYYDKDTIKQQIDILKRQFELALNFQLPVILHVREAFSEIFNLIDEFPELCGVFHCFTGGKEEAKEVIKRNFYISFSGIITYKNAKDIQEAAKITPMNYMLIETDSPYLAPIPMRGKRNEPSFILHVLNKLSNIKNVPRETLALKTYENTIRIFKLQVGTTQKIH